MAPFPRALLRVSNRVAIVSPSHACTRSPRRRARSFVVVVQPLRRTHERDKALGLEAMIR